MALNYWESSQYKITLENANSRLKLDQKQFKTQMWYIDCIRDLAKSVELRYRAWATAVTYFHRFYQKRTFDEAEPALVSCTCLFLSSKVEECPIVQNTLLTKMKEMVNKFGKLYTAADINTCEVYLLEALNCKLIVYHPYRSLLQILEIEQTIDNHFISKAGFTQEEINTAWCLVNDSYFTDILLRYPPYSIALACLFAADQTRKVHFFANFSEEDLRKIQIICNEILELGKSIYILNTTEKPVNEIY